MQRLPTHVGGLGGRGCAAARAWLTRPCPLALREHVRGMAKKGKKKGGGGKGKGGGGGGGGGGGEDVLSFHDVRKALPDGRVLLDEVSLRLTSGSKVGVLGANGAGKSTVLRLMVGDDADFDGRILRRGNVSVAMLEQEPRLDDERDVMSNVMDGLMEQRVAMDRFDQVNTELESGSASDVDGLLAEQAGSRSYAPGPYTGRSSAPGPYTGRSSAPCSPTRRVPLTCQPCSPRASDTGPHPHPIATRTHRAPRRDGLLVPPCRSLLRDGRSALPARGRNAREPEWRPAAASGPCTPPPVEARCAAARRANEPPRRDECGVARALPPRIQGGRRRGDARPLLSRQRRHAHRRGGQGARRALPWQLYELAATARGEAEGGR